MGSEGDHAKGSADPWTSRGPGGFLAHSDAQMRAEACAGRGSLLVEVEAIESKIQVCWTRGQGQRRGHGPVVVIPVSPTAWASERRRWLAQSRMKMKVRLRMRRVSA